MTLTEGILQEDNGLGFEVIDCQQTETSSGNGDALLDVMAPGDEVRLNLAAMQNSVVAVQQSVKLEKLFLGFVSSLIELSTEHCGGACPCGTKFPAGPTNRILSDDKVDFLINVHALSNHV